MSNLTVINLKNNDGSLVILFLLGLGLAFAFVTLVNTKSIEVLAQVDLYDLHNKTQLASYNNTLYVSGIATDKVSSDLVTISIGVQSTNKSATDALTSNSKIANEIISSLRDKGVKDNEISTSQYTIQPNYNYSESGNIVNTTGFTVANILTVQSSNFNNISLWIDSAVSAGANTINGVDFRVSDKTLESFRNKLIEQAIFNAKQKADIASSAIGSTIIGIKSMLVDTDRFSPMPIGNPIMQKSFASEDLSTPIIAGEQEVSITVQIVYLLK